MDTFSQIFNTQRENENTILTSEKLETLDTLSETLKMLTINNAGYYESNSLNVNGAKGDPESDPKIATHIMTIKKKS